MKSLNGRGGPGSVSSKGGSDMLVTSQGRMSMNHESLCNPVLAADIPGFNFYRVQQPGG